MKKIALFFSTLAGFGAMLAFLYIAIASLAFDAGNYPDAPPFDAMSRELIAYLAGKQPALSQELFISQEIIHMEDVLRLFRAGKTIAVCAGCMAVVVIGALLVMHKQKELVRGVYIGMLAFAGVCLVLGLWALLHFESWFIAMHRLLFTNELWLFDPKESMLIQMLPITFFEKAVLTIAGRFALLSGIFALLMQGCKRIKREKNHDGI